MGYKNEFSQHRSGIQKQLDAMFRSKINAGLDRIFKHENGRISTDRPSLEQVSMTMTCSNSGQINLQLEVWFFYGSLLGIRRVSGSRALKYNGKEHFHSTVESDFLNFGNALCKKVLKNFPIQANDLTRYFQQISVGHCKQQPAYNEFWNTHNSLSAYWKKVWAEKGNEFLDNVKRRVNDFVLEHTKIFQGCEGYNLMQVLEVEPSVSLRDISLTARLSVSIKYEAHDKVWKNSANITRNMLIPGLGKTPEYEKGLIMSWMGTVFSDVIDKLFLQATYCIADISTEDRRRLSGLWGRVRRADRLIQGQVEGLTPNTKNFSVVGLDIGPQLIIGDPLKGEQKFLLDYLGYLDEQKHPYTLRRKDFPDNLHAFTTFLELADALYQKIPAKKLVKKPNLLFSLENDKTVCFTYRGKKLQADAFRKATQVSDSATVHTILTAIFKDVIEQELKREDKIQSVISKLNELGLSPCELAILRYLYQSNGSWYTDIAEHINPSTHINKAAIGRCLDGLLSKRVVLDEPTKLIRYEWMHSKKHGDFRMYHIENFLTEEILSRITPRALNIDDLADMEKDAREDWFKGITQAAVKKDELWNALQILEHMPATFAASYVKTNDGRAFLSRLKGSDAIYAKFFVQGLPGCKRLAEEIYKEDC